MRFLILLTVLISSKTFTQSTLDTLHWNGANCLSFKEFKAEPIEGGFAGEIFCMLTANFEKPSVFKKPEFYVTNYFDRKKSWFSRRDSSAQLLSYFQVTFNIYEVHSRNLRKTFAETKFKGDPTKLFTEKYNLALDSLMREYNAFRKETKFGSDEDVLEKWRVKVETELNALEAFKTDLH